MKKDPLPSRASLSSVQPGVDAHHHIGTMRLRNRFGSSFRTPDQDWSFSSPSDPGVRVSINRFHGTSVHTDTRDSAEFIVKVFPIINAPDYFSAGQNHNDYDAIWVRRGPAERPQVFWTSNAILMMTTYTI